MRDDFDKKTKESLARRVGFKCSNPKCRKLTVGPRADESKTINIGVAAHITAASRGGPRYDPNLSPEQRSSISNGIWLCQSCSKLIDNDEQTYSVAVLLEWKKRAETFARRQIEERCPLPAEVEDDPIEILAILLEKPDDWIKVQGDQYIRHRYKSAFVIKTHELTENNYCEPWTKKFPDNCAWSMNVEYWFGSTLLKTSRFVIADGGRYSIPIPKLRNLNPNEDDWKHIEFSLSVESLEWKTAMLFEQYRSLWEVLPEVGVNLVQ